MLLKKAADGEYYEMSTQLSHATAVDGLRIIL